jgi:hypothetical protein
MKPDLMNLINIVMKLGDWINTIWNFHAIINIAVLGWWLTKQPAWTRSQKLLISLVYTFVMAANLKAQIEAHIQLDTVSTEIAAVARQTIFQTQQMTALLTRIGNSNYYFLFFRHIAVDALVLLSLWWAEAAALIAMRRDLRGSARSLDKPLQ